MIALFIAVAAGGCAFFLLRWAQLRKTYTSLTQIEQMQVKLEEARQRETQLTWRQKLTAELVRNGYKGDLFPFVAAMGFLYLAVVLVLRVLGLSDILGIAVGVPVSAGAVWLGAQWLATRRRRKFNRQLLQMLELVAGQIEGGVGAQKALTAVVPNMQEPLRSEMTAVLDAQAASKDLISGVRALAARYPSRAFDMFISALEIDQAEGHAIGPALHQAAEILARDFELSAEASAEISQTKMEFFSVLGVLGLICARLILGGDDTAKEAYFSPVGTLFLLGGAAIVAWGVVRALRLLNKARGDV